MLRTQLLGAVYNSNSLFPVSCPVFHLMSYGGFPRRVIFTLGPAIKIGFSKMMLSLAMLSLTLLELVLISTTAKSELPLWSGTDIALTQIS